ncbi:hypothetical protein [Caenimonas sp. SL110]|uniref:hypothetical protein n=1 Tax=Caenimonas sp. SL110 TaxID=1450524 RepID=UPI000652FCE1|nr:hypothetical protein [Caenimonas sp. SL110]
MKNFVMDSSMLTMGGVFYPTGHMFMMFPTEQQARDAAHLLETDGLSGEEISMLTPQVIQEQVARTVGTADIPLPSAGTEADTVRHFLKLASQGHHALLVHAPDAKDSDRVMEVLKNANMSYGQKYRQLVIEDLE